MAALALALRWLLGGVVSHPAMTYIPAVTLAMVPGFGGLGPGYAVFSVLSLFEFTALGAFHHPSSLGEIISLMITMVGTGHGVHWLWHRHTAAMIAERDRAATEMAAQDRRQRLAMMGELAAGLAHNFNNHLAIVGTGLQLVQWQLERGASLDEVRDRLRLLVDETMRAGQTATALMTLTAQASPLALRPVPPNLALRQALQSGVDRPSNTRVQWDLGTEIPDVLADHATLVRVLAELISNGIASMPSGGVLTLSTRATEREVHIAVSDTGQGIFPTDLGKVFIPLYTTKPGRPMGGGLGLTLALALVRLMRGDILVDSEPGKGSRFTVVLPASAVRQARLTDRDESSSDLGSRSLSPRG